MNFKMKNAYKFYFLNNTISAGNMLIKI